MPHFVIAPGVWESVRPVLYGYEECEPGHCFGPAVRPYYLLHYVHEGEGVFERNGQVHKVNTGDVFVIRPDEVTTYRTGEHDPWKYSWLGFQFAGDIPALRECVLRQPPVGKIFAYIRDHCEEENLDGKIFSLTYELIWRLGKSENRKQGPAGNYAQYARAYLESSYMQQVNIQAIADTMHIDRRYLTRQFKDAYGMPPQTYLMQLRLEKAAEFLGQGFRVTDAAMMAGFTDLPNFSRHFKRYFGVSPNRAKQE